MYVHKVIKKKMIAFTTDDKTEKNMAIGIINDVIKSGASNVLDIMPSYFHVDSKTITNMFDYTKQSPIVTHVATFGQDYVVFRTKDNMFWQLSAPTFGILAPIEISNPLDKMICMVVISSGVYIFYDEQIFLFKNSKKLIMVYKMIQSEKSFIYFREACKIAHDVVIAIAEDTTNSKFLVYRFGPEGSMDKINEFDSLPRIVNNSNYDGDTYWLVLRDKSLLNRYGYWDSKALATLPLDITSSAIALELIFAHDNTSSASQYSFYHVALDTISYYTFSISGPNTILKFVNFESNHGNMIDNNTFYMGGITYALESKKISKKPLVGAISCVGDIPVYALKNSLFDSGNNMFARVVFPESIIYTFDEHGYGAQSIANKSDYRIIKARDLQSSKNTIFSVHGRHCVRSMMHDRIFIKDIEICTSLNPLDFLNESRQMRLWDDGNLQIVEDEKIIWESNTHDSLHHVPMSYTSASGKIIVSQNGMYIIDTRKPVGLTMRFNFINAPKTDLLISKSNELIGVYRRMCWENMHVDGLEFADSRCACLHDERLWTEALKDPGFSFIYDFMVKNKSNVQTLRDRFTCTLKQCNYTLGDDTIVNDYIINTCKNNSIVICNNTVNIAENGKAYDNIVNVINNCGDDLPKIDDDLPKIDDIPQSNTNTIVLATCISLGIIVFIIVCIYLYKNRRRISQYFSKPL